MNTHQTSTAATALFVKPDSSPSAPEAAVGQSLNGLMADTADTIPSLEPLHLVDEISHRVVNEFTEAICALGLVASLSGDLEAQSALAAAATRLRAHVEAHRALQAPIAKGLVNLADYVGKVCACLARAPLADKGVRLTVDADEVWLDAEHSWRVGLIIAELVRNAARHGLSGGAGAIRVEIAEAMDRVCCSVLDDGRGAPAVQAGRGRGLVQALAAELGGSVDWAFTPAGCRVRLDFPKPALVPVDLQAEASQPVSLFATAAAPGPRASFQT